MTHRLLRPSTREVADDLSLGTFERVATANGVLSLVDPGAPTFTRASNAFLNGAEVASGTPRYPYGRNLLTRNQSDVEIDETGFSTFGAGKSWNRSTEDAWKGSSSIKFVRTSSTGWQGYQVSSPVVGGSEYVVSTHLRRHTGSDPIRFRVEWRNAAGAVGTPSVSASLNVGADWTRQAFAVTAPAEATSALFVVYEDGTTVGNGHFGDGFQLEQADTASPWRPGGPSAVLIEEGTTNLLPAAQADALTAEYRTGALTGIHTLSSEVGTVKAHPEWGHGGSGIAKNAASAPIIDLDYLGASKVLWLPGAAGNYASTPDDASLDITGDIDLRAEVALEDWTPGTNAAVTSKWNDSGNQRSYLIRLLSSGALAFNWSTDGSTSIRVDSTVAAPFGDGERVWVRATLNVDNSVANDGTGVYEVKFYTSADGSNWTQLGSTITGAATTSVYASTEPFAVGAYNAGVENPLKGKVLRAQVRNGIDGTLVADFNAADFTAPGTTAVDSTGKTWTINRSGDATAEIVDRNTWVFTGSEFLTMPDRDDLDFGTGTSFTILAAALTRNTLLDKRVFGKRVVGNSYSMYYDNTRGYRGEAEGVGSTPLRSTSNDGLLHVAGIEVDRGAANAMRSVVDDVFSTGLALGTYSFTNTGVFNIGTMDSSAGWAWRGLIRWLALFRRTLTAAEHTELAGWDGTVATEPTWLRSAATLYVNADDPVQRAMYRAHNTVINLASGGTGSVLTMQPADNHAIWMEPATSPQRVQLEAKAYKTSWHTGGATRNWDQLSIPHTVVTPSEGTIEADVNLITYGIPGANRIFEVKRVGGVNGLLFYRSSAGQWALHVTDETGTSIRGYTGEPLGIHRFVAVWNADGIRFWLNGAQVGTAIPLTQMPDAFEAFGIGGSPSYPSALHSLNNPILGVRTSSRARTDAELADWRAPLKADEDTTYLMTFEGNLVYGAGGRRVSPTYPLVDMYEVKEIAASITSTGVTLDVEVSLDGGTTWDVLSNITAPLEHDDVAFRYSLYAPDATAGPTVSSASYSLTGDEWYDTTLTSDIMYDALGPLTEQDASTGHHLLRYVDALVRQLDEVEKLSRDTPDFAGWGRLLDLAQTQDDALPWLAQFVGVQTLRELTPESQRIRIGEAAGWRRGTKAAIRGAMRQYLTGSRTTQIFERYQGYPYRLRVRTFENETPDPAQVEAAVRALKPAGLVLTYDVSAGQSYDELNAAHVDYDEVQNTYPTYEDIRYGIPPEV